MDLFEEMDEMFVRLFTRMQGKFLSDFSPTYGYRILFDDGDQLQGIPDDYAPQQGREEPVAEVHHIGDEVVVIANLPGITEDLLRLDLRGDTLVIDAGDADRHVCTSAVLPPVEAASMRHSLRNGVLEVRFAAKEKGRTLGTTC
jgi:HSP20 family protein